MADRPSGYRSAAYAHSLREWGAPYRLPHSGGWIIKRSPPDGTGHDAMGLYPLFSCGNWEGIGSDIKALRGDDLLSLVIVTDPMIEFCESTDGRLFDVVRRFKRHYLAELDRPPDRIASRHHAYYARRAARTLSVELAAAPLQHLDEWNDLYAQLIRRHRITDLRAFSDKCFAQLFALPDVVLLRALLGQKTVGAQIFVIQDHIAYAHLSAFSDEGYAHGASYLLDWHALSALHGRVRFINWGGGRGRKPDDGLARYKRGWSTLQRDSWLLGKVLDPERYAATCLRVGTDPDCGYFPAYRQGEFA